MEFLNTHCIFVPHVRADDVKHVDMNMIKDLFNLHVLKSDSINNVIDLIKLFGEPLDCVFLVLPSTVQKYRWDRKSKAPLSSTSFSDELKAEYVSMPRIIPSIKGFMWLDLKTKTHQPLHVAHDVYDAHDNSKLKLQTILDFFISNETRLRSNLTQLEKFHSFIRYKKTCKFISLSI
jgi:hypothetical protein